MIHKAIQLIHIMIFAISLTDHYFGNGIFIFADMPIFQFSFVNQKCLFFNAKLFLTEKY